MNNDIIQYYENKGYIFYDVSNKIKSFNDYLEYFNYSKKNYNNLITYINLSPYFNDNNNDNDNKITKFYKLGINLYLRWFIYSNNPYVKDYNKDTIILLYKEKYLIISSNTINCKHSLLIINKILLTKYYECNICFNDKCKTIISCSICNLQMCFKCDNKLAKINNRCCYCNRKIRK
jgi:hypothetical protein